MSSIVSILITLYGPAALSAATLLVLFRTNSGRHTVVTVQPFGILGISFPINSLILARIILCLTAAAFLFLYTLLDYSVLFPRHLQMEVFFDADGLSRTISQNFRPEDLKRLGIAENYSVLRRSYFDQLDVEVKKVLHEDRVFSLDGGQVHSDGETSFIVNKIGGWQRYYVQESKGELTNTLEAPHHPTLQFFTLFEKLATAEDYIDPSFADLILRRRIILQPRFKQLLAEARTSTAITFNVAVTGVTSLTLFPWPSFSPTVYCAYYPNTGLVPIAYAIYR